MQPTFDHLRPSMSATLQSSYEEMVATSLYVDFKEEVGAIEQCGWPPNSHLHLMISPFPQSSTFSEAERRANPMTALQSLVVKGSIMQNQMQAKLASMNLKSPGLKSNMPSSPSTLTFNTSATNCQSPKFDLSSPFLSPYSTNSVGSSSDAATTLAQQVPNSKQPATPFIASRLRLSARAQENAVHGPASVHLTRLRNTITCLCWT